MTTEPVERCVIEDALREMLSPSEAARLIGCSKQRIGQLRASGQLTAVETPLGWLFDRVAVEQMAHQRAAAAAQRRERRR